MRSPIASLVVFALVVGGCDLPKGSGGAASAAPSASAPVASSAAAPAPSASPAASASASAAPGGVPGKYPQFSTRVVSDMEYQSASCDDLQIMKNEIYARHGYKFKTKKLADYFGKQPWYSATSDNVESKLTAVERQNVVVLTNVFKVMCDQSGAPAPKASAASGGLGAHGADCPAAGCAKGLQCCQNPPVMGAPYRCLTAKECAE